MKAYEKNIWEDRIVQYPNRYRDQNNNLLTLTQEPGEVAQVGTLFEATKMNHIEEGIEEASNEVGKIIDTECELAELTDEELAEYTFSKNTYLSNKKNKKIFDGIIPRYEALKQYSTDEIEIGIWHDGRKIYKRTIVLEQYIDCTENEWTTVIDISNLNIDCCIYSEALDINFFFWNGYLLRKNNNNLEILNTGTTWPIKEITLYYLKTDDRKE